MLKNGTGNVTSRRRITHQYGRRESLRRLATPVALIWATGALSGCAAGAGLPPLPPARADLYRLGAGDEVRVIVFGQKQLTTTYRIGAAGMIDLPLAGPVRAAGRTTAELARAVAARLSTRGILVHPSVSVEIRHYRQIYVLGEVNKPGAYAFRPGMTVLTAVSLAGGFTYRALQSRVGVIRIADGNSREYRAPPDALLAPGDTVQVFQRHF